MGPAVKVSFVLVQYLENWKILLELIIWKFPIKLINYGFFSKIIVVLIVHFERWNIVNKKVFLQKKRWRNLFCMFLFQWKCFHGLHFHMLLELEHNILVLFVGGHSRKHSCVDSMVQLSSKMEVENNSQFSWLHYTRFLFLFCCIYYTKTFPFMASRRT